MKSPGKLLFHITQHANVRSSHGIIHLSTFITLYYYARSVNCQSSSKVTSEDCFRMRL